MANVLVDLLDDPSISELDDQVLIRLGVVCDHRCGTTYSVKPEGKTSQSMVVKLIEQRGREMGRTLNKVPDRVPLGILALAVYETGVVEEGVP